MRKEETYGTGDLGKDGKMIRETTKTGDAGLSIESSKTATEVENINA